MTLCESNFQRALVRDLRVSFDDYLFSHTKGISCV